jgi:hypothetical protein
MGAWDGLLEGYSVGIYGIFLGTEGALVGATEIKGGGDLLGLTEGWVVGCQDIRG